MTSSTVKEIPIESDLNEAFQIIWNRYHKAEDDIFEQFSRNVSSGNYIVYEKPRFFKKSIVGVTVNVDFFWNKIHVSGDSDIISSGKSILRDKLFSKFDNNLREYLSAFIITHNKHSRHKIVKYEYDESFFGFNISFTIDTPYTEIHQIGLTPFKE